MLFFFFGDETVSECVIREDEGDVLKLKVLEV